MLKNFAFSLDSGKKIAILSRSSTSPPPALRLLFTQEEVMAHKSSFTMRPLGSRKRVLLVVASEGDAARRSAVLRRRGYDVDSVTCAEAAVTISRTNSYDLIVVPVDDIVCVEKLCRRLQKLNPNSTIACLADCQKPLPSLPAGRLLWKGEPMEYFLARVDALSAIA
jgi:PleD family two-component response regulator